MKAKKLIRTQNERAQTMVEFALILPFLLLLILGVIEVGRLLFIYTAVATSSREAARYGSASGKIGGTTARYQDCSGMRASARRMGVLVGIADGDIAIHYVDGDTGSAFGNCPVSGTGPADVGLGDRVVVQVTTQYQPLFTLLTLPFNNATNIRPFPITSISRRTLVKDVNIIGTPPPMIMPYVMFSLSNQTVNEDVGTVNIVVRLSNVTAHNVIVPFTVSGTATPGADHSLFSGQIVIPAGIGSKPIVVTINDDLLDEDDEVIVVTMGTPVNAVKSAPDTHIVRILDNDDPPTVAFTTGEQSHLESVGTMVATLQLSAVSGKDITIPFAYSSTATEGTDYTITASPLLIPAGTASVNILIAVIPDTLDEDDEAIVITLGTPVNATRASPDVHTAWIVDDDNPPFVRFAFASSAVMEGMTDVVVKVELSAASGKEVTVPIQVGGTALNGTDYTIPTTFPLVIPVGMVGAEIHLSILSDIETELDETILLDIGVPTNGVKGIPGTHTMTITNVIPLPKVSFTTTAQSVSEAGGSVTVIARLDASSILNVSVPYTVGGTASLGVDYSLQPAGSLVIPAGSATAVLTVYLTNDTLDEDLETAILTLGTPVNAELASPSVHTVTIVDDDSANVFFTASGQEKREDLGSATAVVQLSTLVDRDVVVPFTVNGTAQNGIDYTITASPVVIPAGTLTASITVNLVDDADDEPDETVVISLGTPTNAIVGSPAAHTLTILDNDTPVCEIFDDNELSVKKNDKVVSWTLYNQGTDTLVLTSLTVVWPAEGVDAPKLDKIKFDNKIIWDGNLTLSPATVSSWMGMTSDRTLTSKPSDVGLIFTRDLLAGPYQLTLLFHNVTRGIDCTPVSTSYTSP